MPPPVTLAIAVGFLATATARGRVHPLLALVVAAACFGFASAMSVSQVGKVFGTGFGQTANSLALPVLAAAIVACIGARAGAAPSRVRLPPFVNAAVGVLAGTGALPGASFAVLSPLRAATGEVRAALTMGLAISAGQALLLPSPVLIAATAILAAPWTRVLAFGAPLAMLVAGAGALFAALLSPRANGACADAAPPAATGPGAAVVVSCLTMALMLCIQSLGDIPSEPFGGGSSRELILGIGRPVIVLLAGVGIMAAASQAWRNGGLSETGWAAAAVARAAPLMLLVAAAGGFGALTQASHMAELTAERLLPLNWGLALPFLLAAVMKVLQGSSLVAAITAAGMMQGLLAANGLDDPSGRALAVLAVGAGATTGAQVNDGFFWLVAEAAKLRPARAFALVTGGTVVQGVIALAVLSALRALL